MVLIYSTTPHDTGELVALRQVINDNERGVLGSQDYLQRRPAASL